MIDPIVNVTNAWMADQAFTRRAEAELFKAAPGFFRDLTADEGIELLEAAGVTRAIIGIDPEQPDDRVLEFPAKHPDRFVLAAEPRLKHTVRALWAMEDLCRDHPVVCVRTAPMLIRRPATDPLYYPLYAKCVELDLPLTITTGMPGPPLLPADVQNPMHLDQVCLDFPDLHVVMLHGADPWWEVAIRLMLRHRHLTMVTSAWAPRHLPEVLLRFMNTRGREKVMFGSDYPILPIDRCVREARELPLEPEVLEHYLHRNARRVFFGPRNARHIAHAEI